MTETLIRGEDMIAELARDLRAGGVVPYLGPGISALAPETPAPLSPEALAAFFETKVALPKRAKGNAWASAQHIESYRHRNTVTALMAEAYSAPPVPTAFHKAIAAMGLPMIVDSWYAGEMRAALAGVDDWAEVQGITRSGIGEFLWYRFYLPDGTQVDGDAVAGKKTILYTPHGSIAPATNFLISDADYVEVLTEIDIQTPIPEIVRDRRTDRTFLFLGCRFHDQLLRSYARQIIKRSRGEHYAVLDVASLTRNEKAFLAQENITPIDMPLAQALALLMAS
jgi:hypothetical protein